MIEEISVKDLGEIKEESSVIKGTGLFTLSSIHTTKKSKPFLNDRRDQITGGQFYG